MIPCAVGTIDPERERQRLREEYSRMLDGKLEQLADAATQLTDLARWALREEISRRGLALQSDSQCAPQAEHFSPATAPATVQPSTELLAEEIGKVCVVRKFVNSAEALIARGRLDSAGIPCSLADENVLSTNPLLCNAFGGMRLFVKAEDFTEAAKLLDEPILNEFEVEGVGRFVQPHCPQCFSVNIAFGELDQAGRMTFHWDCHFRFIKTNGSAITAAAVGQRIKA